MYEMPRIKIELEGLKHTVQHMFTQRNDEINEMICNELDKVLSQKWVESVISSEVENLVRQAVLDISNNYQLRDAITNLVADNLTKLITGNK